MRNTSFFIAVDRSCLTNLSRSRLIGFVDYECTPCFTCWYLLLCQMTSVTGKWHRAAVGVISNSRKYDRDLTYTRRHELHWTYSVLNCSHCSSLTEWSGTSISHWTVHSYHTEQVELRSSCRNRLAVPLVKLSIGSRSFSVSGPTVWNALPDHLRSPTLSIDVFKLYLKTFLFTQY